MRAIAAFIVLAIVAAWSAPAAACSSIVGWVGVPLCQASVAAPNVVGLSLTDADTELEAVGLDTGVTTPRCSSEAADQVLRQNPLAGTVVPLGSSIDLVYSDGMECPPGPPNTGKNVHSISIDMGIRL